LEPSDARQLAEEQLAALADVGALLDSSGFEHWLFGGWAVDFHVGSVTRAHRDIDLAVPMEDADAIHAALTAAGWRHDSSPDDDGGTGFEHRGVRLELTYVIIEKEGRVFVALRDHNALWSAVPLGDERLELHGVRARVIPLTLLRDGKSRPRDGPDEAVIDRNDFDALSRLAH
jgi:hypothetical protein